MGVTLVKGFPGGQLGNLPPESLLKPSSHREGSTDLSGSSSDSVPSWGTEGLRRCKVFFFCCCCCFFLAF